MMQPDGAPTLELQDLDVVYKVRGRDRQVLRGVTFTIQRGETYGLVGESGSGKSTAALAVVGYLPSNGRVRSGSIRLAGQNVVGRSFRALRRLRANDVSMVYQDPGQALNPSIRIGDQVAEVFQVRGAKRQEALQRAQQALAKVQIADPGSVMGRYPHQLSGGMQQRAVIAMALAKDPALLILDEPTTSLDATVEAEVLDLILQLKREFRTSVLFITHNLGIVAKMCDRVGVLYAGRVVEEGPVETVLNDPRHPYTVGLIRCVPRGGMRKDRGRLDTIPGFMPSIDEELKACVFADRCGLVQDICRQEEPPLYQISHSHASRCYFHEKAKELPRAAAGEAGPADPGRPFRDAADRRQGPGQRFPTAGSRRPCAGRRLRRHLVRRNAGAGRRVGQRQDHLRARAARADRAQWWDGLPAGPPAACSSGAAVAGGHPRPADRVSESGLGAQPPPHGATHPAPGAVQAGPPPGRSG
jgi:peptide/nickel transport system ATP-binding protein